jgi:hypothetical protein
VNEVCPATSLAHAPVEHENDDEHEHDWETEESVRGQVGERSAGDRFRDRSEIRFGDRSDVAPSSIVQGIR